MEKKKKVCFNLVGFSLSSTVQLISWLLKFLHFSECAIFVLTLTCDLTLKVTFASVLSA